MNRYAAALAAVARAAPVSAQTRPDRQAHRGHSPQLGKPTAQTTGSTPAAVRKASGAGAAHGARAGSGKVVPVAKGKSTAR